MRSGVVKTPTNKKTVDDGQSEKSSGKKLVQARLPFKILAPGTSSSATTTATAKDTPTCSKKETSSESSKRQDARKRKLSYETENDVAKDADEVNRSRFCSKENLNVTTKKKKVIEDLDTDVVLLDDDDEDVDKSANDNSTKLTQPAPDAHKGAGTPKSAGKTKRKSGSTPQNAGKSKNTEVGSGGGSASKVMIKLPLNGSKNRRRKSLRSSITKNEHDEALCESSDDIEAVAGELNPIKRQRVETKIVCGEKEVVDLNTDSDEEKIDKDEDEEDKNTSLNKKDITTEINDSETESKDANKELQSSSVNKENIETKVIETEVVVRDPEPKLTNGSSVNIKTPNAEQEQNFADVSSNNIETIALNDESDEETDVKNTPNSSRSSDAAMHINEEIEDQTTKTDSEAMSAAAAPSTNNATPLSILQKKNLTPKQLKLMEQRRKAREEKERKLQEERKQKQREKEEREQAKKREREEKEEQRRKEREEKEEQRRKERDEKERKRLAEIEAKNEEKRKRNEAKEEEQRKKDEVELKKKKAAEAFTKFFVPKAVVGVHRNDKQDDQTNGCGDSTATALAFRPFQIKGAMKLAPLCRKIFTAEARGELEALVHTHNESDSDNEEIVRSKPVPRSHLYLSELMSGKILPFKWRRPSTETKEDDDDVLIVEDELERAGQGLVEETHAPLETHRAKFYKFHENRRPPYYGTWRKSTKLITARRPFGQDKKYFDYDVDSDDEWEEEEPGESLDGSDDEKEKESEDDDYEVDNEWFVPHGHLSDEEMQNEDECGGLGDGNTREAQKAKLKILQQEFAQEMKKKTEKLKPRLIGCIWADENGNQPALCPKIIWDTLNGRAMLFTVPPLIEEPEQVDKSEPGSPSTSGDKADKLKPIVLTEEMLKILIRLIHGNSNSKVFLIKEFIAHLEANEEAIKNGDVRGPLKSTVREKIDEYAEWQVTETNESKKKRRKTKKRLCWIVANDVLQKMDLQDLGLQNGWQYTLEPKTRKEPTSKAEIPTNGDVNKAEITTNADANVEAAPMVITLNETIKTVTTTTTNKTAETITKSQAKTQEKLPEIGNALRATVTVTTKPSPKQANVTPAIKKRVPLLMSVARGQQISAPAKNALISQFLKKSAGAKCTTTAETTNTVAVDDDVVMLD